MHIRDDYEPCSVDIDGNASNTGVSFFNTNLTTPTVSSGSSGVQEKRRGIPPLDHLMAEQVFVTKSIEQDEWQWGEMRGQVHVFSSYLDCLTEWFCFFDVFPTVVLLLC